MHKLGGIYSKIFFPLMGVVVALVAYAYIIWLPASISYAIEQSEFHIEKTMQSVTEGLVPLLLESQLSNIYDNLDSVKTHNPNWLDLQLFNTEQESLYPLEPNVIAVPTEVIHVLKHPVMAGKEKLGELVVVYDFSKLSAQVTAQSNTLFFMILLALAIFIMLAAVIIYLVIFKPINKLTSASDAMARGQYDVDIPAATGDEVGKLIQSFSTMRDEIRNAQEETIAHNEELQQHLEEEHMLREQAFLQEQLVMNAKDGVILTKAGDLNDGPYIIYVNDAFTNITGYSKEEAIGKTPRMLQGENTDRTTLDAIRACLEAGESFRGELINYTKSGREYWLDINIIPIRDSSGHITHYAAIERDITERKNADRAMEDAMIKLKRANMKAEASARDLEDSLQIAEKANQAKSEFLANMSHELRTPMNGVLGLCEILLHSRLDDEQRENAETIHKSGQNLLSILNDILDISKIEAGELEIEHVPFDVGTAIKELIQLFIPRAQQKDLELSDKDVSVPDVVMGDLGKIQQVLRNLVGNAIKFTAEGSVSIACETISENQQDYLYFAVKDTGMGIPADKLDSIFEKFSQADTSVTRKFGGTGLGLAICQHMANLMGGSIGVQSVEGKGSSFWFTIPLIEAEDGVKPVNIYDEKASDDDASLPVNARILAADDHPVNRMFVEKMLRKLGFKHIDFAENGQEALDKITANNYDVVLMDCQMPELDGYHATIMLRQIEDAAGKEHIPVIALTANAMVGDREKCLRAGMDDYLSKPIKGDKLAAILRKWLTKNVSYIAEVPADEELRIIDNTQTGTNKEPPVDMEHLAMFTDGDPDEEKALFDIFFSQSDLGIRDLETACSNDDHEAWRSAAHTMKGAAANLGANTLSTYCKKAEDDWESELVAKEAMLSDIKIALEDVRVFLQ